MNKLKLHSKLMDLQSQFIHPSEQDHILDQILRILLLRGAGEISIAETGKRIRQLAWKISEDLQVNGVALSSGTDQSFSEKLPMLFNV